MSKLGCTGDDGMYVYPVEHSGKFHDSSPGGWCGQHATKGEKKKDGGEDRQNARAQRGQHCKCGYVTVHLAQIPEQGLNLNRS